MVSVERTCMECGRPSLTDLCIDCERGLVPDYDVYDDPDAGAEYREPVAKRPRPATSSRPRPQVTSSLVPSPYGGTRSNTSSLTSSPEPHSWTVVDLVARAARPPEPPDIIGLFYPGYFHLLSGESEALKTWLALVAAAEELRAGRGVLWVDGDDVGDGAVLERLRLLGVDDDVITAKFAYMVPAEPLDQDRLADVLAAAEARACRLAVMDGFNPLLVLHGLNPDSGSDVETFYRLINPIRKLGAATILTDNVVKAATPAAPGRSVPSGRSRRPRCTSG